MSDPEIKHRIIEFLTKYYPKDFNILEVANAVKIHRNTASTYLKVLTAEKKIIITRTFGKTTLYALKK